MDSILSWDEMMQRVRDGSAIAINGRALTLGDDVIELWHLRRDAKGEYWESNSLLDNISIDPSHWKVLAKWAIDRI
jgi:hypothetical protein